MRGPGQSQSQTPAAHPTLVRQFSSLSHPSYPAHDPCPHCELQSKGTRHAYGGRPAPRQAWLVQRLQGARQTTDTQAYFPTYVGLKSLSTPNPLLWSSFLTLQAGDACENIPPSPPFSLKISHPPHSSQFLPKKLRRNTSPPPSPFFFWRKKKTTASEPSTQWAGTRHTELPGSHKQGIVMLLPPPCQAQISLLLLSPGSTKNGKTSPRPQMEFGTVAHTPVAHLCQVQAPGLSQLISQGKAHSRRPNLHLCLFYGVWHCCFVPRVEAYFCRERASLSSNSPTSHSYKLSRHASVLPSGGKYYGLAAVK